MVSINKPFDESLIAAGMYSEHGFKSAVLALMLATARSLNPFQEDSEVVRINGTYTGTKQQVLPASGAGFKYRVRSLYIQTENSSTTVRFLSSPDAMGADTNLTPEFNHLGNSGAVMPVNSDGWFETAENHALYVTSSNNVDLLGTVVKVPV